STPCRPHPCRNVREAQCPRPVATDRRGPPYNRLRACVPRVGRSASFRPPSVVCTEAAPGGQREALTNLRSTPCLCAWCRAVGVFPAAECGVHRGRARWPTRGVDHLTIDSVPVCLV